MKLYHRCGSWLLPLCLLAAAVSPASGQEDQVPEAPAAQEEEPPAAKPEDVPEEEPAEAAPASAEPLGSAGAGWFRIEAWVAQPKGMDYAPATVGEPDDESLLTVGTSTEDEGRYVVGWEMPGQTGRLVYSYYAHEHEAGLSQSDPGEFVFGEILPQPDFAGFADDGLADAFNSATRTSLHDQRIDFSRPAFGTPHARGRWLVGWRRVSHRREIEAEYFAVLPNKPLPVLLPPVFSCDPTCPDVSPESDFGSVKSYFTGRGLTGGLDIEFPLWREKLVLDVGLAISVLRGEIETDYFSSNNRYEVPLASGLPSLILVPCPVSQPGLVDEPPCEGPTSFEQLLHFVDVTTGELCETAAQCTTPANAVRVLSTVVQAPVDRSLEAKTDTTSSVVDAYVGFRWPVLEWLEVVGGFRQTRYDNVGLDLEPSDDGVTETEHSATYEGFYGGVTFRLWK